jgi:hypothetical protein
MLVSGVGSLGFAHALPEAWNHWKYSRPLDLEPTSEARLVHVTLPMEVFGRTQKTQADLRIVDHEGEEIPYIRLVLKTQKRRNWLTGHITELSFVPGQHTYLIVDTGTRDEQHNRLEVEVEQSDFFSWVEVAVSDDRETWRIVRERAPLYDFPVERVRTSTIAYPNTRARWIRLLILNGKEQFKVERCRVAQEIVERGKYVDWPLILTESSIASGGENGQSVWQVDSGVQGVPVSAIRFEAEQPEFHRPVRVSASDDGEKWIDVAQGDVFRYHSDEPSSAETERLRTSMRVEFDENRGRYWRTTIVNRNDAPVEGLRPTLQANPYQLVFRQEPGQSYRLLYGHGRAEAAQYDLQRTISRSEFGQAVAGQIGEEEVNTSYVSPEPWTEQHPGILWGALFVALLVLGFLAVRSLRHSTN